MAADSMPLLNPLPARQLRLCYGNAIPNPRGWHFSVIRPHDAVAGRLGERFAQRPELENPHLPVQHGKIFQLSDVPPIQIHGGNRFQIPIRAEHFHVHADFTFRRDGHGENIFRMRGAEFASRRRSRRESRLSRTGFHKTKRLRRGSEKLAEQVTPQRTAADEQLPLPLEAETSGTPQFIRCKNGFVAIPQHAWIVQIAAPQLQTGRGGFRQNTAHFRFHGFTAL
jgi:hypothetical protein